MFTTNQFRCCVAKPRIIIETSGTFMLSWAFPWLKAFIPNERNWSYSPVSMLVWVASCKTLSVLDKHRNVLWPNSPIVSEIFDTVICESSSKRIPQETNRKVFWHLIPFRGGVWVDRHSGPSDARCSVSKYSAGTSSWWFITTVKRLSWSAVK